MHELAWKCAKRFVLPSARSKYEHVHDGEMHKGIHAPDLAEEEKERERNVDRDGDTETGRPRGQIMDVDEKPYDIVICPSYGYKVRTLFLRVYISNNIGTKLLSNPILKLSFQRIDPDCSFLANFYSSQKKPYIVFLFHPI